MRVHHIWHTDRLIFCLLWHRVAEGLSLDSHAAKCAEIFGVPTRIVRRAQYVRFVKSFHRCKGVVIDPWHMIRSHLISTHEIGQLLDEEMTESERLDLEDAEAVCRKFSAWNFQEDCGNVKERLAEVLGREKEEDG